jgi:hypothetical protein
LSRIVGLRLRPLKADPTKFNSILCKF